MKTSTIQLSYRLAAIFTIAFASFGAKAGDISSFVVAKAKFYYQSSTGAATLSTNEGPYIFHSTVEGNMSSTSTSGPLNSGILSAPGGIPRSMEAHDEGYRMELNMPFSTENELNTNFATGTYTFNVNTVHDGNKTFTIGLPAGSYPNVPHLNNYTAAQAINPTNLFRLTWDSLAGTATRISIEVRTTGENDDDIYSSGELFDKTGFLPGTATSFDIPAYTLAPGSNYLVQVIAAKVPTTNTTALSGATGYSGYASILQFPIKTTGARDVIAPKTVSGVFQNGLVTIAFSETMQTNHWYFYPPYNVTVSNPHWDTQRKTFFMNVSGTNGTTFGISLYGLTDTSGNYLIGNSYPTFEIISASISPRPYALAGSLLTCNAIPSDWTTQYQWKLNGTNIAGANEYTYRAALPGTYSVVASYADYSTNKSFATASSVVVVNTNQTKQIYLQSTNNAAVWYYYGTNFVSAIWANCNIEPGAQMVAQADFNRDGQTDFLWQKGTNLTIWKMFGTSRLGTNKVNYAVPSGSLIASGQAFTGGGASLLQYNPANLLVRLITLTNYGTAYVRTTSLRSSTANWKPVVMADFCSDTANDILWQNTVGTNRQAKAWYGSTFGSETNMFGGTAVPTGWNIVGAVDLSGDNQKDILLQNSAGEVQLWVMNRTVRSKIVKLKTATTGWKIVGPK